MNSEWMKGHSQAELLKMVRIDIILNDIVQVKLADPNQNKRL